ncbi:BREX-1 system phosphatase PglZ type A [Algoriphagus formosus]|uniref:BREX-1 system phosphatase PglZ type A n=1 Tax=Algoriphagus formosus TaxID=2007308 RepID=UPI0012FDCD27|nr:BREX-1 system phosphatase PglZ type A [Algoriphagus formosus]
MKVKFQNNFFGLKNKLFSDWSTEKVLIYFQIPSPHQSKKFLEFPLLDLLEANMELVMDDEEAFIEEFGLNRAQKNIVKKYIKELQYSSIQEVCSPILAADKLDELSLQVGLISAFLKFSKVTSWENIIAKMLLLAFLEKESDWKRFWKKLTDNGLRDVLAGKLFYYFGEKPNEINQEYLTHLLQKVRYNQITHFIQEAHRDDPYKSLKIKDKRQLTSMFQLLQEASNHPQIGERLEKALAWVGKTIHGSKIIDLYGVEANYGFVSTDMAWILLAGHCENLGFAPNRTIQHLEKILISHELDEGVRNAYDFFIRLGEMIFQINSISSYTLNTPEDYLIAYTIDWYKIDSYYRRAIESYRNIQSIPDDFDLDRYYLLLNKWYDTFLENSNREWLKCLSEKNFDYQTIKAPKQYDFYFREIADSDVKTVVIISDALRFEAAKELLGVMHGDDKNIAEIGYQLASMPSKTSIGMAQLLPNKSITFNKGTITINGISTEGVSNRQQILESNRDGAVAISFNKVMSMPLKEARELFKAPVVYVYHDIIDARGDKKTSERGTFNAVNEAVQELGKFVNKLHHTFNVTRVFVTSDHGFVYQDQEIEEKDKEPAPGNGDIGNHNRYELSTSKQKLKLGYCFPLSATTKFEDGKEVFVTIPESINRYRKQGVGHQFVHGGGTLQEVLTPVINSYRKTQAIAKKVRPIVTNEAQLRIVSNILRVSILQEKKVSRTEKELTLIIGLYKENDLVSNELSIELNSVSESPTDRTRKVELILNSSAINESILKLKGFDSEERLNPIFEIRVQNQTIIPTDF